MINELESIWNEPIVPNLRHYPGICLENYDPPPLQSGLPVCDLGIEPGIPQIRSRRSNQSAVAFGKEV
jgi:hypothetical protein